MMSDSNPHRKPSTQQNPASKAKHPANDRQSKPSTQQGKAKNSKQSKPSKLKKQVKNNGQSFALGVRHPKANPAKQKGPKRAD